MKVVNLEKKVFTGLIIGVAAIIVIAGIVVWQKRQQSQEIAATGSDSSTLEHRNPIPDNPQAKTNAQGKSQSSQIAVGGSNAAPKSSGGATEVTWELLYELDYRTGKMPENLRKLNNKRVRLPGFVVPLSDDMQAIKEFLLVPNAQACIHVPAPPPNLIVYAILAKAMPVDRISNPSWIEGTLIIEKTESEYGDAGYKMMVDKVEEYKF